MTTELTKTAGNAEEAYARYMAYRAEGQLITGGWHKERDGRDLACALGMLGPNVNSPRDCPAAVMPRWLAQMVPWFFDTQPSDEDAFAWGERFYAELRRLNGAVPFSVVHDWHARVVGLLAIETAEKRGKDATSHKALAEMQWKAVTGQKFTADEWRPVLKAAFYDIYLLRYADADADADADAYAYAYAYAYANADAYADADAYAYAYADYRRNIKRLADGMVECLARVETPE